MVLTFGRGISVDGKTLYFDDQTTYGAGDEARNNLALVALAIQKLSTGDVIIQPAAYLAESVITFNFDVTNKDSVYEGRFWALPLYTGQSLSEGDIVYDLDDRQVKKYVSGSLGVITVQSLLNEEVENYGTKHSLVTTTISQKRDLLELKKLEKLEALNALCCEYNEYEIAKRNFDYVRTMRSAAYILFCQGNYVNAQLKVETGNSFADSVLAQAA